MMPIAGLLPATATRVERWTPAARNRAIRERTDSAVEHYEGAPAGAIEARLQELNREWDIERALQANAAGVALAGLALSFADRRFLLLPAAVFTFFLQHALFGWCPPVPVLRRLGVRTVREIERERYALKALRGDFDGVPGPGRAEPRERVRATLAAVDR